MKPETQWSCSKKFKRKLDKVSPGEWDTRKMNYEVAIMVCRLLKVQLSQNSSEHSDRILVTPKKGYQTNNNWPSSRESSLLILFSSGRSSKTLLQTIIILSIVLKHKLLEKLDLATTRSLCEPQKLGSLLIYYYRSPHHIIIDEDQSKILLPLLLSCCCRPTN